MADKKSQKKELTPKQLMRKKRKEEKLKKKLTLSVPVPEGLKKAWERENRAMAIRKKICQSKAAALPKKRQRQADRIKQYEQEYMKIKSDRQQNVKDARKNGNFFKDEDPKIAIVIRIRGINRVSPKVRKVLQLFRLLQIHNAVFIRMNKATINMLKLIQPYIAYGYPSVACIRSLIYKRGFAKIRSRPGAISRIPIMSSELIEKNLGRSNIETVEDMVHEIATVGPNFTKTVNFLWPFKLNCPKGGYRGRKRRHFLEGGTYGNWEHHINNLVQRML
mmetsp:Transcript_24825/g.21709  ORF Transcript_24825/g.21709 Transcript_24825/m.21709 type:complete len:277 (+) Transcript_24825:143-973(+)